MGRVNRTRGAGVALLAACYAFEWHTMRVQERTRAAGMERNDTWSQITRDVFRVDTLVGKVVIEVGCAWLADWFPRHLQEHR